MSTLANSFFQMLLGWLRTLASDIWATIAHPAENTLLSWMGKNWVMLSLLLCGAGLMIDLVVYLFRWQPFRVWFRFLHRLKKKEPEEDTPDPVDLKTERSPSIPSDRGSEAPVSERPGFGFAAETFSHARKNSLSFREDGDGEEEPVFAPRRPNPSEDALFRHQVEPEGTTASFEQAILPRRRRRISRILQDHDQEDTVSPDQLIDQRAAYRKPVYPRNWKDDRSE